MEQNMMNEQGTYEQAMNSQASAYGAQQVNGQQPVYGQAQAPAQKKSGKGRKVGYFFLSLTPFLACMGIQLVVALLGGIVVGIVGEVMYMVQNPTASPAEVMNAYMSAVTDNMGLLVLFTHITLSLTAVLWYYFGCGRPKLKASAKNVNAKAIVLAVAGGLVMNFLANGMVGVEMYVIPEVYESYVEMMEAAGMGVDVFSIIAAVCLAPVGEELICRGLTIYYAKKAMPKFFMVNILQAFLFAVMHGNLIQGSYAFVLGLFLGYLAEKTHSLLPCMLLHFVVNFASTFIIDSVFSAIPSALWIYAIILVISAVVTLLLVWWGGALKEKEA